MEKIVSKKIFQTKIKPQIREENKKIALCHGVFDLVHPGHMIHLQQAKEMADILVVSVTASKYVRKGLNRPYFNDRMRMQFLEAIECVDYVMLSEGYTVDDIVETVEPDFYVKGEEYINENDDITGNMTPERKLVEKHGGKMAYTNGPVFSSTKLINTALSGLTEDVVKYMKYFLSTYSMQDIKKYAERVKGLNILVIGDVIIDKYTYCNVQGLMSKDTAYSARLNYSEEYLGGAVAIARHLSNFTEQVALMSIIGSKEGIKLFDELKGKIQFDCCYSDNFPTIIKHRYLMRNAKREEYRKIFSINNIPESMEYEEKVKTEFRKKLTEKIEQFDVVFVCDFGHGLIDEDIKEIIQKRAKYLALNCQTNSSNQGMNIITKYNRADVFTLDQKELKLAYPMYVSDEHTALRNLGKHLGGDGWLTRGSQGAWGIQKDRIIECPAFTLTVKDTVGAGDAFYAISGLFNAAGAPLEIGTFLGNIAGALGANILGNKEAIEKVNVLKYASTLLNI